jgi:hypothetical protein
MAKPVAHLRGPPPDQQPRTRPALTIGFGIRAALTCPGRYCRVNLLGGTRLRQGENPTRAV